MNAHVAEMMATERLLGLRREAERVRLLAEARRSRVAEVPRPAGSVRTSLGHRLGRTVVARIGQVAARTW